MSRAQVRVRIEALGLAAVAGGLALLLGGPAALAIGTGAALVLGAEVACRS